MSLYDLLDSSDSVRMVSLLWVRETYLRETVRLGGRVAELIYKGSLLDLARSYAGSIDSALDFALYNDCWDGMLSTLTERDGILSGYHAVKVRDLPERLDGLRDYSPRGLFSVDLCKVLSGGSVIWERSPDQSARAGQGPATGGASPSGNVAGPVS